MTSHGPEPRDGAPEESGSALFRAEAVAEQQDRWLGGVLLVPRISHTVLTGFAALILAGVLGLFAFGDYTRKVRLSGWIAPEQGLIQIVAPQAGVLTRLQAQEGLEVAAGATLAVLSADRSSEALGATQAEVVRTLRERRDSLQGERERQAELSRQQAVALEERARAIAAETDALDGQADLLRRRLDLAERELARQQDLRTRGIAVEQDLRAAERMVLDAALALQELERERRALERTLLETDMERRELPLRTAALIAETDRALAALGQELAEAEAAREIVVAAPEAGTVTALRIASGSPVGADAPLMTLVPAGSDLEARLYGPSRTIGFIRPGQRVLLRYEAYPHQKFGLYEGVVRSVSRSTVAPSEAEDGSASFPSLTPGEPLYRVTVELARQTASAYGQPMPLHPGMQLEADILIETRQLHEWVLDPLQAMTGRDQP
jgi:membrane fusion protein